MEYVFLTEQFYADHADCPEIEKKQGRPYTHLFISAAGVDFAIPFRSSIKHEHAFWTDKRSACGLDYSKAIVIEDAAKYIEAGKKPYIRPNERKALFGKDYAVRQGLLGYMALYARARAMPNDRNYTLVRLSTMQYFEKYVFAMR